MATILTENHMTLLGLQIALRETLPPDEAASPCADELPGGLIEGPPQCSPLLR